MNEQSSNTPISDTLRQELGRVGVLFGGESAEREVSLQSGTRVLEALIAANVDAMGIDTKGDVLTQLQRVEIDRAFIVLHGAGGEDGCIQALLGYLGIPYTGSGVQASALAMDKLLSKQLWRGINLPTPDFVVLTDESQWDRVIASLGNAAMVKPSHEGSSLGMSRAESAAELAAAYQKAKAFDSCIIAESLIRGPEYTVTVLNGEALPAIKLETENVFYDYEAKYISNDTRYLCPCGLAADAERSLQELALKAYRSLGCKGWARVDFMADVAGKFYLLEVNTVPGMTSHSLVPMAAKAAGINFEELVVRILLSKN
ncbi:MAG: D-alanine--D-alanine ligase [Cellvibrionaceae bacterium]